jgi:hypothetical protein
MRRKELAGRGFDGDGRDGGMLEKYRAESAGGWTPTGNAGEGD